MQNFGRENFDDSTCIREIRQTFPPSKFYAIWYEEYHPVLDKASALILSWPFICAVYLSSTAVKGGSTT